MSGPILAAAQKRYVSTKHKGFGSVSESRHWAGVAASITAFLFMHVRDPGHSADFGAPASSRKSEQVAAIEIKSFAGMPTTLS
jgi:hypothetical protein